MPTKAFPLYTAYDFSAYGYAHGRLSFTVVRAVNATMFKVPKKTYSSLFMLNAQKIAIPTRVQKNTAHRYVKL